MDTALGSILVKAKKTVSEFENIAEDSLRDSAVKAESMFQSEIERLTAGPEENERMDDNEARKNAKSLFSKLIKTKIGKKLAAFFALNTAFLIFILLGVFFNDILNFLCKIQRPNSAPSIKD